MIRTIVGMSSSGAAIAITLTQWDERIRIIGGLIGLAIGLVSLASVSLSFAQKVRRVRRGEDIAEE